MQGMDELYPQRLHSFSRTSGLLYALRQEEVSLTQLVIERVCVGQGRLSAWLQFHYEATSVGRICYKFKNVLVIPQYVQ
jgi:hypothetical protein